MVRKTKEEAQATRDLLLDTAEQLFSENGVSATSLNDIAIAAGLTRGAVYWHFENKVDLLMALWERVALPIEQAFANVDRDVGDDILLLIKHKACWMAENIESNPRIRALMNILMLRCEFATETAGARMHFLGVREQCMNQITRNFEQAIDLQLMPPETDAEQAAIGLFGLTDGICFHWLIAPERFSIRNSTHFAVNAYIAGLSGQKTQKRPKIVQ